jgi:hypothetical protein
MSENTAVSSVESEMLATNPAENTENIEEQSVKPVIEQPEHVPKNKPASIRPEKTKMSDKPEVSNSKQIAVAESDLSDSGMMAKLKQMIPYGQYIFIGFLFLGLIFVFVKLSASGKRISALEKSITDMKDDFNKREAEQNLKFSEALNEKHLSDTENRKKSVASETLNKLRDGLPEKRLIRKQGGDWYAMGKHEESVGNQEVIEILNNAYAAAKSAERTGQVVPPHTGNAIVVLKPDGKGGTIVKTAYDYIVGGK